MLLAFVWLCFMLNIRYLYPVSIVVQKENTRACHFFGFYHRFEVCQQAHMFRHVRC